MVRSYQTLGVIHGNGCPEGAKPKTSLISLTEQVYAALKMAKTEKHCWWMRRKEIEASQLNEALNNHPPFLSFCGLTLPKHFCCCVLRGLCCLENRQCHREQQAGKTSSTDGWQDLPPEDLNVLESLRNQGVVGWSHHCPKSRLESCRGQSHSHPLPRQPLCLWGGGMQSQAHQCACPPASIWTLNNTGPQVL